MRIVCLKIATNSNDFIWFLIPYGKERKQIVAFSSFQLNWIFFEGKKKITCILQYSSSCFSFLCSHHANATIYFITKLHTYLQCFIYFFLRFFFHHKTYFAYAILFFVFRYFWSIVLSIISRCNGFSGEIVFISFRWKDLFIWLFWSDHSLR